MPKGTVTVKAEALQNALRVLSYVPATSAIESSQYIKVSCKSSMQLALSGEAVGVTSVALKQPAEFVLFLDRDPLTPFLGAVAPDAAVALDIQDGAVTLKSAKQRLKLANHAAIGGYASWDRSKARPLTVPDSCRTDLPWLARYVGYGPYMEQYTCVRAFKGYGIVSTDSLAIAAKLDRSFTSDFQITANVAKLIGDSSAGVNKLLADKNGVGAIMPGGYVYQTFAIAKKEYPLKAVQSQIESCLKTKALLKVKAEALLAGLKYLGQFGKAETVSCRSSGSALHLSSQFLGGEAHTETSCFGAEAAGDWEVGKLVPLLEHLEAGVDVEYSMSDVAYQFRAASNKQQYILVIAKK